MTSNEESRTPKTSLLKTAHPRLSRVVSIEARSPPGGRRSIPHPAGSRETRVGVSAFIHADGHDALTAVLQWRKKGASSWKETPLILRGPGTDIWDASFVVETLGTYEYTVEAWIDPFISWRKELGKKVDAGQDVSLVLEEGARMIEGVSKKPSVSEASLFKEKTQQLRNAASPEAGRMAAEDPTLAAAMFRCSARRGAARSQTVFEVLVERTRAAYGAWYEMFPRSTSPDPQTGGHAQRV
jgi:starch synthase (maltosyl-transferring)